MGGFFLTREIEKRARFLSLSFFFERSVLHLPGGEHAHCFAETLVAASGSDVLSCQTIAEGGSGKYIMLKNPAKASPSVRCDGPGTESFSPPFHPAAGPRLSVT